MSGKIACVGAVAIILASLAFLTLPGRVLGAGPYPSGTHATGERAHAAKPAGPHKPGDGHAAPNPLVLGPDLALVTAVVFLLLLLVLTKFAWRPIVEALDRRERSIAENIAAAAARREEAERLLRQYEADLRGAAAEIRSMLEEARRSAEGTKAEIIAEAKRAAQAEQQRAVREVQDAAGVALRQLAERTADLAIDLAGRIVQQQLSASDHARLIRDTVSQLPSKN